ncbi:hypothetical protein NARC_30286 [Candidatus Nitrosocosmicus arcticus]|uniref:Uncharacterized protein n=1 Tax=Candidatus Nitrosocosmicus arcticus TaxID=2035267 RepID=A0A557SY98_9ARCH|nr:hypothetical protein NARC_30286 [Candidatus Nitrosocosmicus arcticus]
MVRTGKEKEQEYGRYFDVFLRWLYLNGNEGCSKLDLYDYLLKNNPYPK